MKFQIGQRVKWTSQAGGVTSASLDSGNAELAAAITENTPAEV